LQLIKNSQKNKKYVISLLKNVNLTCQHNLSTQINYLTCVLNLYPYFNISLCICSSFSILFFTDGWVKIKFIIEEPEIAGMMKKEFIYFICLRSSSGTLSMSPLIFHKSRCKIRRLSGKDG
jgi:hypothetical protein